MRLFLLSLLLFVFAPLSFAQSTDVVAEGDALLEKYETLFNKGQMQEARALLDRGVSLLQGTNQDTLIGKFYNLYTYWYYQQGKLDSALQAQLLTVKYFERGFGPLAEPTGFAVHNSAFLFQKVTGQIDSALHYYQRGLRIYEALDRPLDIADEHRNIGLVYTRQNNYGAAQRSYLQALAVLQEMSDADVEALPRPSQLLYIKTLSWLYLNIAEVKLQLDDIRELRIYLQYSQDILSRYAADYPELKLEIQESQARLYNYLGQSEKSLQVYQSILDSIPRAKRRSYYRIIHAANQLYLVAEQYEKVIELGEQYLREEEALGNVIPNLAFQINRQLVKAYVGVEDWERATEKAIKLKEYVPADEPQTQAYQLIEEARVQRANSKIDAALATVELAMATFEFPPSQPLSGLQALKSDILFQLYQEKGQSALLDSSQYWAEKSWSTLTSFESEVYQRRSFGRTYRRPTECLLQILFERYEQEPSPAIEQEVLTYIEAIRGRSLKLGRQWQVVDEPQREQYQDLRQRYLNLLQQRYEEDYANLSEELRYAINDSLVAVGQRMDVLQPLADFGQELKLTDLQAALPNDQKLALAFFVGKDHWFVLAFSKAKVVLHSAPLSKGTKRTITQFKREVKNIDPANSLLAATGFSLYKEFLKPVLQQFDPAVNQLLISGDGLLSALPWAALSTELPQEEGYREWPFLVDQYRIAYLPHLTDLLPRSTESNSSFSIGCFAPVYPDRIDTMPRPQLGEMYRNGFWSLPGAQQEVRDIVQLYGAQADLFADEFLTANAFQDRASAYSVLHLALHAVADETFPDESYLLFPDPEGGLEYLTALDLLAEGINADLLILSACYAGDGPWKPGDGVMSLAYALRQAGARSVLSNYWATADELSKDLMVAFHRYLKEGEPLDAALQKAQIEYRQSVPLAKAAHPFYWAGFHLQGGLEPLEMRSGLAVWWPWVLAALILIAVLYWRARRSTSARSL
ncbi:MAG: CHAT domain-containing tetratricopeptide repeat protein [Bacteroidota bacterium]